jgi:pyruvate dehydrogenase E1 component
LRRERRTDEQLMVIEARSCTHPAVTIVAVGAMLAEALAAADRLAQTGTASEVVVVACPSRIFEAVQARRGLADTPSWIVDQVFPTDRAGRW